MSVRNHSRPIIGVGVLLWRGKQLLLGKRLAKAQQSCWQFPGGHLENGESVIDCAHREVLEETGLLIHAPRHLGFTNKSFTVGQNQYVTLFVSAVCESGEAQTQEPEKCELWQWFDYRQLPTPLFTPITVFLAQQANLYALHCASQARQDSAINTSK